MKEFIIGENDSGQRLERFVLKVAPHLPKGLLFKFLRTKKIKCNGKRCEASQLLEAGDQLRLFLPNSFFESKTEKDQYDFLCAPNQIQVLYEDTNILIVDKPVGLVVHTDDNHTKDTLIHRIQHYLYQEKAYIPEQEHAFAPALCNRLDRNTSGIVIAAKTALGLREMNQMIREDRVQKVYLCVAVGKFQKQSDTLYGYHKKIEEKERRLKVGRQSEIVAVIPNVESTIYRDMVGYLKKYVSIQGYQFYIAITDNDIKEEAQVLEGLIQNKKTAGIIHVPVSDVAADYKKLIESGIPFVCMERNILGDGIDSVEFRDREAIFKGTDYLLECGHKNILFLRESLKSTTRDERTRGFLLALEEHGINTNDANISDINIESGADNCILEIQKAMRRYMPTAIMAGGNRITLYLMKTMRDRGIECPEEISVVGFGDEGWSELTYPPLTILKRDVEGLSRRAVNMLFEKINTGHVIEQDYYADVELIIRKSTRMLDNGPFGEEAATPESIVITKEEKSRLRAGNFRVAISFHYTGTSWAELHEKGIRDELEQYGIDIISVTDAHFDASLQNAQLEGIRLQKPDAVIAIPADDKETKEQFRELAKVSKLVFLSNVPENMEKNSYVCCVSVNEIENGVNVGRMMGEYCKGKHVEAGFIIHGAVFYGTRARDEAAEKIISEQYKNIDIKAIRGFGEIENAYQVCKDMITENPQIKVLYVSWDRPALLAIKALKEMHREDIAIFTTDLDYKIAQYMESGIVKGLSTQRPYEQGRTAAHVVAKSLLSNDVPKYVGVQPYVVDAKQLGRAWKDIFHEGMPEEMK